MATASRATSSAARRLVRADFNRPTLTVTRDLLGKFIVRNIDGRERAGMIIEAEAYQGPRDRASHACGGRRTARVEPIYGEGGTAYVYLCYGIHWLLNFATVGKDKPQCVLIRAVLGEKQQRVVGPGNVTRYLEIDKRLNGVDVTTSHEMWVEDRGIRVSMRDITRGPRVGVDYAGAYWAARKWRFRIDAKS